MFKFMAYIAEQHRQWVIQKAYELGFSFVGFSEAQFLEDQAPGLESWLNQNYHGSMAYMANHFDKRLDPRRLVEGAKTVISVLFNYYPAERLDESADALKISKYAYGEDYHDVMKKKLHALMQAMQEKLGDFAGRAFVDSAPVMDKVWAAKSGLGWVGKNSNLITRKGGSFFFIGEIICDLAFEPDGPMKDYCGRCRACLDACPTDAIVAPYVVDGSKCISYYTIELKDAIPQDAGSFEGWIFGCDICQDVCPWNRFSKPHQVPEFLPKPSYSTLQKNRWLDITHESFGHVFKNSPIKRAKWEGFARNVAYVLATHEVK